MVGRFFGMLALGALLTGCGSTTEQRAATGGLAGVGIGALAGGPIGALIGAGIGAAAGAAAPAGVEQLARLGLGPGDVELSQPQPISGATDPAVPYGHVPADRGDTEGGVTIASVSPETTQRIQAALRAQGLYDGPIDGVLGPQTNAGLVAFRLQHGRPPWPVLDVPTLLDLLGPPPETERRQVPNGAAP